MGVARGGSWGDQRPKLRCANRLAFDVERSSAQLGFRLAADVDPASLPDLRQLLAGLDAP